MGSVMVKRLLLGALLVIATLDAQGPAVILPGQGIGFDYSDADLTTYQVRRFEGSWDGQAFGTLQTTTLILPDTPPGFTTYRIGPPFTTGTHTVQLRACNDNGCGQASAPFPFAFVVASPVLPVNVRVIP